MELNGIRFVYDLVDGLIDLLGGRNAGVADGIIEYIFLAHDFCLLQPVGKQLTDHRGGGA